MPTSSDLLDIDLETQVKFLVQFNPSKIPEAFTRRQYPFPGLVMTSGRTARNGCLGHCALSCILFGAFYSPPWPCIASLTYNYAWVNPFLKEGQQLLSYEGPCVRFCGHLVSSTRTHSPLKCLSHHRRERNQWVWLCPSQILTLKFKICEIYAFSIISKNHS